MRRALFAALALAVATPVLAETAGPTATLAEGQILRGRFVQERHLQGFAAPLRSEGHFVLASGHGLIWQAEKPFAITTVITAAGLVQEAAGAPPMRLTAARLPFLSRLYDMFEGALAGDWRTLAGDFTVTRTGDDRHWRVELAPRKGEDPVTPIHALTLEGGRFVDRIEMTKPGGDVDDLTLTGQTLSTGPLAADETALLALPAQ